MIAENSIIKGDVESAPWYRVFQGDAAALALRDRLNDHHLSLEEKHRSREEKSKDE
jgi:hypothetical protein